MVAHIEAAVFVHQRDEVAADDAAARVFRRDDVPILPVMKNGVARYLAIFCVGDGAEGFVVVVHSELLPLLSVDISEAGFF